MNSSLRWPDAALAGFASSMRTTAGPAMLAARGQIGGRPRVAVMLACAGELAADKLPFVADRIAAPALGGRIAAGAYTGRALAGPAGAAAGAISAGVGSYATFRARALAVDRTRVPAPLVALGEDAVALAAAALATRPQAPREERERRAPSQRQTRRDPSAALLREALRGVAIGAVGTAAMTVAQGAERAFTRSEVSDAPVTAAAKIKRRLGLGKIKRRHRPAVNQAVHWLYGSAWGVPYQLATRRLRAVPEVTGPVFGTVVWATGLVVQPALGVAQPPWKRSPASLGSEALLHLVYGAGAAAAQRSIPS